MGPFKVKWLILFLLGLVAAAVISLVSQSLQLSRQIDQALFFVLILLFLAVCGRHVLQADKANVRGGGLLLFGGKSMPVAFALAVIGLLLLGSLLLMFHVVTLHSLESAGNVRLLLFSLASFLVLLVAFVQLADVRFYENGVFLKGQFHEWQAIEDVRWCDGESALLIVARADGPKGRERALQVSISPRQRSKIEDLLLANLGHVLSSDEEAELPSAISIIP